MMLSVFLACSAQSPSTSDPTGDSPTAETEGGDGLADVVAVSVDGEAGAWSFSVTISSPDTGCERYADWWEVISESGDLHYRRILNHSHTDEQPFTRSGSPVPVSGEEVVIVRAHLNPDGYGGAAMQGSVEGGFAVSTLAADFAADLATAEPQPDGCAF